MIIEEKHLQYVGNVTFLPKKATNNYKNVHIPSSESDCSQHISKWAPQSSQFLLKRPPNRRARTK